MKQITISKGTKNGRDTAEIVLIENGVSRTLHVIKTYTFSKLYTDKWGETYEVK